MPDTDYYTGLIPGGSTPPDDGDPNATRPYVVTEQAPRLAAELLDDQPPAPTVLDYTPRKPLRKRWSVRIPVLVTAGLIAIIAASSSHSHPAASVTPAPKPAVTAPAHKAVKPAQAPVTTAPAAPAPAQPAAPAAPAVTVSQQQALDSAKSYLDMGGFSRAGLIDQLTSHYGEKFTLAQATYAANHVGL